MWLAFRCLGSFISTEGRELSGGIAQPTELLLLRVGGFIELREARF